MIITDLIVKPFERKEDTTWFPIQVKLNTNQTLDLQFQYSDFIQYSKLLHQQFQYLNKHQLIKLHKKYYFSNKNQKLLEIESFCRQLLALPSTIQCSHTFLSFFIQQVTKPSSPLGLLKRSFSIHGKKKPELPVQAVEQPIKFKVIHDMNNMIVIRVSRSITLNQLKAKVIQKFAMLNIELTNDTLMLRAINNYQRYSISSCSSAAEDSLVVEFDPIVQIDLKDEQVFSKAMHEKWYQTQKVILKCIP